MGLLDFLKPKQFPKLPHELQKQTQAISPDAITKFTRERYELIKAQFNGLVNVYRTAPDDSNRMNNFPCLTIMLRNNVDIRNYLLTDANFDLVDIPKSEFSIGGEYELWKKSENPYKAFFFFDILFGESSFPNEEGVHRETKLSKLKNKGYVFLRNKTAQKWDDYEENRATLLFRT